MHAGDHSAVQTILAAMADGVLVIDQAQVVVYANAAASRFLSTAEQDLIGQPVSFALPAASTAELELPAGLLLELRSSAMTWQEQPARLVLLRDMTAHWNQGKHRERRQHQAVLERYAQIIEQSNDAIITIDLQGTITTWNPGAARMYGYAAADVIGKPVWLLSSPEQYTELRSQLLAQTLACKRLTREVMGIRKNGERFSVHLSLAVLTGPDGTVQGIIGYAVDLSEQKRAETRLRIWRRVFDNTRLGVALGRAERASLELVNPAFAEMHGYTVEELTGQPVTKLMPPEEGSRLDHHIDTVREQGYLSREIMHVRKDGTVFPVQVHAVRMWDEQQQVLYHMLNVQDISERKRAEEALRHSEQLYRVLVQNIPDGNIFLFDRDARIFAAEGSLLSSMERKDELYLGKTPVEMLGEEHGQAIELAYRKTLAGEEIEIEVAWGTKIFRTRVVPIRDEHGQVYAGLSMGQDITKLKQVEREIRSLTEQLQDLLRRERQARSEAESQRALLRNILDQSPAVMAMFQGPTHVIQYVNQSYCKIVGQSEVELVGQPFVQALPDLYARGHAQAMDEVYRTGKPQQASEIPALLDPNHDGTLEQHYFTAVLQPMRDAAGRVIGLLSHSIDVTEHVHAKQALERKSDEVARLNRELEQRVVERTAELVAANTELEAFAYSVSHDLRAPLQRIDGFGQILLEEYASKLDADGQHYLQRIRLSSQHMGELIDDLLWLARVSQVELQVRAVDLSAMAAQILATLQEHAPQRQVTVQIVPALQVWADGRLLHVALENLLDNAWKFTSKTAEAVIEIGVELQDGERVLFVRDNGAGFEPQYLARLFVTFSRLHGPSEFPGTGIGLATVKRVIERHGGRIWAEGAVNGGATFYFTLPDRPGAGQLRKE